MPIKTPNKTDCRNKDILRRPGRLRKKGNFIFARTSVEQRQADFENLQNQPRTKPKPRNKANQNHRKPKHKPKTLKPISATWQRQPEIMPTKKLPPKKLPPTKKPRT
jgi:hypothetical protein